ncbi:MAG: transketolase, partial [Rhodobacteraceae bacterium]|nr:transketolase [Paracoccaceae bacterium]
ALSRQGLPTLRTRYKTNNLVQRGAYTLANSTGRRRVILLASGSEVMIAMAARDELENRGVGTRVVSVPCWELFAEQDEAYRRRVLPSGPVRIAIEAGIGQGWERWTIGERGREGKAAFIGMTGFGASAPAADLYRHFGITAEAVIEKALELCGL